MARKEFPLSSLPLFSSGSARPGLSSSSSSPPRSDPSGAHGPGLLTGGGASASTTTRPSSSSTYEGERRARAGHEASWWWRLSSSLVHEAWCGIRSVEVGQRQIQCMDIRLLFIPSGMELQSEWDQVAAFVREPDGSLFCWRERYCCFRLLIYGIDIARNKRVLESYNLLDMISSNTCPKEKRDEVEKTDRCLSGADFLCSYVSWQD
ncbi:uncharacterized protein [Miscanthus floridulus]|uniref:uncharacterized protein n=1 Tax=Miscanthus floridulus TaxID=154761 RepID=UPI0034591BF4